MTDARVLTMRFHIRTQYGVHACLGLGHHHARILPERLIRRLGVGVGRGDLYRPRYSLG